MRVSRDNAPAPSRMLLALAFAAIYVLWGSTYLAIRYTVETLPPFLMAGVRAFVAGALLFTIVGMPRLRTLTLAHWRAATISGGFFFLGCHGLLFRMEKSVDSGVAALMLASIPAWMVILSCLAWRTAVTARAVGGLILGFAGVALLVLPGQHAAHSGCSPAAACVLLVSAMSWACGSLYCRSASLPEHAGTATAMQLLCGGALAILVGLSIGEGSQLGAARISVRAAVSLVYLIIFGSLVSFSAYTWLLRVADPASVGSYAYVNPVAAVLLGWLFAGEPLSTHSTAAAVAIILSVVLMHHDPGRRGQWKIGGTTEHGENDGATGPSVNSATVDDRVHYGRVTLKVTRDEPDAGTKGPSTSQCASRPNSTPEKRQEECEPCWIKPYII